MAKAVYLTTPLYYVNAAPHIGHSYTTIAADALARFHRLRGDRVFLLTGTDEHGQKISQAAAQAGQSPQAFADQVSGRFRDAWKALHISFDDFIRTTQPRHEQAVQRILARWFEQGKLRKASYQGWYCMPDETFWTEAELTVGAAGAPPVCPTCGRGLEPTREEGWYLELRASQSWLVEFVRSHPQFVQPETRYNELMSLLEQPLPEYLCITRPKARVSWGIEVPFSPDHVVYVWIDALFNYISVPGYPDDPDRFAGLWPADVHFIGKDILRHHAVYWPIMLHALGLPDEQMPKRIFAHGHWKVGEQKMSKSLGNIVDPWVVMGELLKGQPFAADIYRYFLLREIPFGQDGSFSEDALSARLQAELSNDLGNLLNRACSMIARYAKGLIPAAGPESDADRQLRAAAQELSGRMDRAMQALAFHQALEAVMGLASQANRYIETQAPWVLAKQGQAERLNAVLRVLAETLRVIAIGLDPFMPNVAAEMWRQLGLGDAPRRLDGLTRWPGLPEGASIGPHPVLFPRAKE